MLAQSRRFGQLTVAVCVLALGLILGGLVIDAPPVRTGSPGDAFSSEDVAQVARDPDAVQKKIERDALESLTFVEVVKESNEYTESQKRVIEESSLALYGDVAAQEQVTRLAKERSSPRGAAAHGARLAGLARAFEDPAKVARGGGP